ncbi:hypothetical protein [Lancefieldella rimae]|uniref:hypothetical protein n=1 Tax=Lancefieldella rimae TaxID=1383 RepID=UPI00288047C2|nr:hypothetical protein [Lancefieldella rimae]
MGYIDFVKNNTDTTDMRVYLVGGDAVAVTIRIPANLRDSAKKEAELRGTTFSSLLRECLVDELTKDRN